MTISTSREPHRPSLAANMFGGPSGAGAAGAFRQAQGNYSAVSRLTWQASQRDKVRFYLDGAELIAADRLIVMNRVKQHTDFSGEYESGLMKMLAIGVGKREAGRGRPERDHRDEGAGRVPRPPVPQGHGRGGRRPLPRQQRPQRDDVALASRAYRGRGRAGRPQQAGQADAAVKQAVCSSALNLVGLHCHIGSQVTTEHGGQGPA